MFLYIIILLLFICFLQDVKYRAIHWLLFPSLLVCILSFKYNSIDLKNIFTNNLFLIFMMTSLTLYLTLKFKKLILITNGFFSAGDILFLVVITPLFTFSEFVSFFTLGTIITLLIHLISLLIKKQKTVPYAGYMSLITAFFLLFQNSLQPILILPWG